MPLLVEYFIINTPSVRLRRTATPFKKGELKTNTRPVIARSVSFHSPVIARFVANILSLRGALATKQSRFYKRGIKAKISSGKSD